MRGDDRLDLLAERVLDDLVEIFGLLLLLLPLLLLLIGHLELGTIRKLPALKLLELSDDVFINQVDEKVDLEAVLLQYLKDGDSLTDAGDLLAR